ncbi:hypothetical protein XACN24_07420 [Xanthomonas albilineans]|uniref:hypothetical protein n=1 Tax=Xanthomonas albilineans TaxID=29447 RepID=UPI0013750A26|nr:hypothetical protein [Xanthomonas albilineans]
MSYFILGSLLTIAGALSVAGIIRIISWLRHRRVLRWYADYRAFVMLQTARRARRKVAELDRLVDAIEKSWGVHQ